MDRETVEFFQPIFDSINRELAEIRAEAAESRAEAAAGFANTATRHDLIEFRKTVISYSARAERLFEQMAGSQAALSADVEALKLRMAQIDRRMAALEERLPPPEAA